MTTGILVVAWSMFAATKIFEERREHPHRDVARRLADVQVDVVQVYRVGELATHSGAKHLDLAECLVDVQSTGRIQRIDELGI